jgi:MFS family permease
MKAALSPFIALYGATFVLMVGMGLLGSFLGVRLTIEGVSVATIGRVMAAYYVGLLVGAFYCSRLIQRVGHIRSFSAFAAVTTGVVLIHALHVSPVTWALLRFLTGIAAIGLYTVIESWLCECSPQNVRGRVFAIYMVVSYLGQGIGQQLLNVGAPESQTLFILSALFISLCIVPVATTHSIHPSPTEQAPFKLKAIFLKSPVGVLGCLVAGMISSAFYSMGPVFCQQFDMSLFELSWFMTAAILGGLLLQWPIGAISDRFDRSLVLMVLGGVVCLVTPGIMVAANTRIEYLTVAMVVYGGLIFSIYPVSVARAQDLFDPGEIVSVSTALLFAYGVGATLGPLVSSMAMETNPYGLFFFFMAVSALYALIVVGLRRSEVIEIIPAEEQGDFVFMQKTSVVALHQDLSTDEMD